MAGIADTRAQRLSFWQKMAIGLSAFIVFGFAQFGLRGMVDYAHVPLVMHLHAMAMLAWLGLLVTQSLLVGRPGPSYTGLSNRAPNDMGPHDVSAGGVRPAGGLALHRTLGWASVVMLPLIVVLASLTCLTAIRVGLVPPMFTPPYFLALVHIGVVTFAALAATAVLRRDDAGWHKRLMIGSTVMLMEPALGRVLPMPLIMPWGEWVAMVIQLGVIGLVVRHDKRELRAMHPATTAVVMAIALNHVLVELLAIMPWWVDFTARATGA